MKDFLLNNWQIILGFLGTGGAWFGALKIKKQNERTLELENMKTVRAMEKALLEDMEAQVTKLIANNERLEKIVTEQAKTIRKYETKFGEL